MGLRPPALSNGLVPLSLLASEPRVILQRQRLLKASSSPGLQETAPLTWGRSLKADILPGIALLLAE